MGFSLKRTLRKLDTGARRTMSGLDDLRRGDVKGARQKLKQAAGVANTFARSTFEQARRDVHNLHRAHQRLAAAVLPRVGSAVSQATRESATSIASGDAARRFVDTFLDELKKTVRQPGQPARNPGSTLPVEPPKADVE